MIGLQFSRDNRFLLSLSDFYECSITIWSTQDYTIVSQATAEHPIHSARWHPFSANQVATVGRNGTLCFWYLDDEKQDQIKLEVC